MAFTLSEAEKCYQTTYLPLNWVQPQNFSGNDRSELNRRIDQNHASRAYCFAAFPAKIKQHEAAAVRGAEDYFRQTSYLTAQSRDDQESFLHGIAGYLFWRHYHHSPHLQAS